MDINQLIVTYLPCAIVVLEQLPIFAVIISKIRDINFKKDTEELRKEVRELNKQNRELQKKISNLIDEKTKVKDYEINKEKCHGKIKRNKEV